MIANDIIVNKYIIEKEIGKGKFGTVYGAINTKTNEPVAIKTEFLRTSTKILKHETTILKYLYDHGLRQIPVVYWYGIHKDFMCLVMPLYNYSLQDYISNNKEIPISKLNDIMIILINIIESIHKLSIIHRDIKPHNFMLKNGELFCIDFGFSTFYLDENSNHFPLKCHDNILGTPKYVSYNIHNGNTPARRDDAISLGYIYISLFCRELPWDTLKNSELNDAYDVIHIMHYKNQERKNLKSWENLSYVANKIGSNFYNYLKYCYSLDYHETPNYEFFRELFAK